MLRVSFRLLLLSTKLLLDVLVHAAEVISAQIPGHITVDAQAQIIHVTQIVVVGVFDEQIRKVDL